MHYWTKTNDLCMIFKKLHKYRPFLFTFMFSDVANLHSDESVLLSTHKTAILQIFLTDIESVGCKIPAITEPSF